MENDTYKPKKLCFLDFTLKERKILKRMIPVEHHPPSNQSIHLNVSNSTLIEFSTYLTYRVSWVTELINEPISKLPLLIGKSPGYVKKDWWNAVIAWRLTIGK